MTTSSLLRNGPGHIRALEAGLVAWMEEHEYTSVSQLRGSANQTAVADPSAYERVNYLNTLHSWTAREGAAPS